MDRQTVEAIAQAAGDRFELFARLVEVVAAEEVLELGVWKGDFAAAILSRCPGIRRYWMLDPWRSLEAWNKPFNVSPEMFDEIFAEAKAKTEFAAGRRRVLRGTTKERIGEIADGVLDIAY